MLIVLKYVVFKLDLIISYFGTQFFPPIICCGIAIDGICSIIKCNSEY